MPKILNFNANSHNTHHYFNSLNNLQKNKEYLQNKMQIDTISNILINKFDVPEKLIDWLVEATAENVAIEYESFNDFNN